MDASWAQWYPTLRGLRNGSGLVAIGTISKRLAVYTNREKYPDVFSDFVFDISRVVANPKGGINPSTVVIHQTGGLYNNTLYEMEDDPLFQPGQHLVLFLREYAPGHYFVVAGPEGRFNVDKGMVSPLPQAHVPFMTWPIPIDQFLANLK